MFGKFPVRRRSARTSNELFQIRQRVEALALIHPGEAFYKFFFPLSLTNFFFTGISIILYDSKSATRVIQTQKVDIFVVHWFSFATSSE
jgi:4'-phosphopantetheinyl transferase EntD